MSAGSPLSTVNICIQARRHYTAIQHYINGESVIKPIEPKAYYTLTDPARVIWFTGLSGAGKTTLSSQLKDVLSAQGITTQLLDGDLLRKGLCMDLGFSPTDRHENIRRAAEVAKLFANAGTVTLAAFMSPQAADRKLARQVIGAERFIEIYCRCPLDICEQRDTKGLYRKARQGQINHMVGIDANYEEDGTADLIIDTDSLNSDDSLKKIIHFLGTQK